MFCKIESQMFPKALKPGLPVVYYPVDGIPKEHINLSNPGQFLLYEVESVTDGKVALTPADDMAPRKIEKHFNELVDEGTWWTRLT